MALNKANFMRNIVKDTGNFQATDLKSMDQAALSQQIADKDRRRNPRQPMNVPFGMTAPMSDTDWRKRMDTLAYTDRRLARGGMNFTKKDSLEHL